jgi:hypothetical protein
MNTLNNIKSHWISYCWIVLIAIIPLWLWTNTLWTDRIYISWLSKLDRIIALLILVSVLTRIHWSNAYKVYHDLINIGLGVLLLGTINSFIFNYSTSSLYLRGMLDEVVPLLLIIFTYIHAQQHRIKLSKYLLYILSIVGCALTLIIYIQIFLNVLVDVNLINIGLASLIVLVILQRHIPKTWTKAYYIIILLNIIAALIYYTPFGILLVVIGCAYKIKTSRPELNLTRIIVISTTLLVLYAGLNSQSLIAPEIIPLIPSSVQQLINNHTRLITGYGVGNVGEAGNYEFGKNYDLFSSRPIIQESKSNFAYLISENPVWIIRLTMNGGLIYTVLYLLAYTRLASRYINQDWSFWIYTLILGLSLVYNPLAYLPLSYLIAILPLANYEK